jgi:hypothetical protein
MATCVRRAWLDLNGRTLDLDDDEGGWICTTLDLGWPEAREVTTNRPDADGIDDRTRYFGARAVSADIRTTGNAAYPDEIAAQWGYYMRPSVRADLHYVLDRPGAGERVLTVRASGYSWPIDGGRTREVHLSWVAADPVARDALQKTATAWAGSSTSPGRTYDFRPDRFYPPGGGVATTADLVNSGDVPVAPLLRIYGPITAPQVRMWAYYPDPGSPSAEYTVTFEPSFVIGSGEYVEVDCANRAAYRNGDPTQPVVNALSWVASRWPVIHPLPESNSMTLAGDSTAGVTQVQALWHDGYIT